MKRWGWSWKGRHPLDQTLVPVLQMCSEFWRTSPLRQSLVGIKAAFFSMLLTSRVSFVDQRLYGSPTEVAPIGTQKERDLFVVTSIETRKEWLH